MCFVPNVLQYQCWISPDLMVWISKSISLIIILHNLTPKTAAFSSSLDNEIVFIGANLVLVIANEQWGFSVLNINLR